MNQVQHLKNNRRAVFLDRDGVINKVIIVDRRPYPPRNKRDVELIDGVPEALQRLRDAGFLLIVVTNQPDVARGNLSKKAVHEINGSLLEMLPIDEFQVCFHDDSDRCKCRKPAAGSLLDSAEKYGIDLGLSYMIGDRWRDIEAGRKAGCKTFFIDYGYDEKRPSEFDYLVAGLPEATKIILGSK